MFKKWQELLHLSTSEKKGDLGEFHEREMDPAFSKQVWKQDLSNVTAL